MKNNTLNFITYFNIGSLNEKKIKRILDNCAPKYTRAETSINNSAILITSADNKKEIQITPNQITINRFNFEDFQTEIQDIQEDVSMIIDTLMLEDIANNATVNITNLHPFNSDTMKLTNSFIPSFLASTFNEDSKGVGLRFLLKEEHGLFNEFKIEPFISDSNYLFIQGIYNYMNINCKTLLNTLNRDTIDFNSRLNGILNNIKK